MNTHLPTEALSVWASDMSSEVRDVRRPTIQAEIIPLACVWSLAKRLSGTGGVTSYQFTQELLAHESAVSVWADRARRAGDMDVRIPYISFDRYRRLLEDAEQYPLKFELLALLSGRPEGTERVTGVEKSIIGALGHAAYNCTSGGRMFQLEPFGPFPDEPRAFMSQLTSGLDAFVEQNL